MNRLFVVAICTLLLLVAACATPAEEKITGRGTYENSPTADKRDIGALTATQVEQVKVRIHNLKLPTSVSELRHLVPKGIRPVHLWFKDNFAAEEDQPVGGATDDYWLNPRTVLRVGISYHRDDSRIEWIQLLSDKEAYDLVVRPPY